MKLIALSVGPYNISTPGQISAINALSLNSLLRWIITLALSVAILLSFIFVVIAGLRWMLSQGDKKAVDEARKTLTLAIGGLVLAFLSFFIVNLIGYAFGIPLLGR